jgi:hypothetical protein
MFSATVNTGHEHEVLVDHPDAGRDRVTRAVELQGRPVDDDLALVGTVEPVQDVHQGRLAGPVLPEEPVDLPRLHEEVHVVVGDHAGEPLGDPTKLELHLLLLAAGEQAGLPLRPTCPDGHRPRTLVRAVCRTEHPAPRSNAGGAPGSGAPRDGWCSSDQ